MTDDPQAVAEASAAAMWQDDHASRGVGMALVRVGPGEAVVAMTVTRAMTNGHGSCHGGYIFLLADSAFAYACNSYDRRHVAQSCQISFVAPARLGMRVTAHATERHRAERSGIYDARVTADDGTVIAEFRGVSRSIPGRLTDAAG